MRGARPIFFFFYKFSLTYVYIYIDRKPTFIEKGNGLSSPHLFKATPNFTYFVECRRIHISADLHFFFKSCHLAMVLLPQMTIY